MEFPAGSSGMEGDGNWKSAGTGRKYLEMAGYQQLNKIIMIATSAPTGVGKWLPFYSYAFLGDSEKPCATRHPRGRFFLSRDFLDDSEKPCAARHPRGCLFLSRDQRDRPGRGRGARPVLLVPDLPPAGQGRHQTFSGPPLVPRSQSTDTP